VVTEASSMTLFGHSDFYCDDSDDGDMFEFYQYVESERGRLEIEKYRQREKWLKFEYPEDQSADYDPADGDLRGEYKQMDKGRKKTWHRGKGGHPHSKWMWGKIEKCHRIEHHRQSRYYNKKYTLHILKAPQLVDKYHHGTKVVDTKVWWW
jgi:hypothetical protein